ncbi:MAG: hypothetical protein M3R38_37450 [Actinomycetota bacterium]|nr:hypothetical protein [Actinomycetota bacterium]
MSERPSAGRNIAGAFRNRERGGRRSAAAEAPGERAPAAPKQRRKRKKTGKRSDPSYTQVSALVMKDVKARFAVAQAQAGLEEGRVLEFGELVNLLMAHFAMGEVSVEELRDSLGELLQE